MIESTNKAEVAILLARRGYNKALALGTSIMGNDEVVYKREYSTCYPSSHQNQPSADAKFFAV